MGKDAPGETNHLSSINLSPDTYLLGRPFPWSGFKNRWEGLPPLSACKIWQDILTGKVICQICARRKVISHRITESDPRYLKMYTHPGISGGRMMKMRAVFYFAMIGMLAAVNTVVAVDTTLKNTDFSDTNGWDQAQYYATI
jgi:hypothetical protein